MAASSLKIITTILLLFFFYTSSVAVVSIRPLESISDGTTLVSRDGSFELGFFSPGSSKNRYLGIWYKNIPVQTIVWVANRCSPINDSSGLLMINNTDKLVLLGQKNGTVWYAGSSKQVRNPVVQLLDSGNLVLRDELDTTPEAYLWQSFDYPSDTFMPGMKLGWDLRIGLSRRFSAWKNIDDPCPGDFTWGIELDQKLHTFPEYIMRKGAAKFYRAGPWNGLRFSSSQDLKPNPLYDYQFVYNDDEVYYTYSLKNKSVISRIVINQTTSLRYRMIWIEAEKTWRIYASVPKDYCDTYGLCGPNGNCMITESPVCQCLKGFKPKSPSKWNIMEWSEGCVRNNPLSCQEKEKDGFIKFSGLKLPDTASSWVNKSMNLNECRAKCLRNCSCMAYANMDIRGQGSGCAIWFGDLKDIRQFPSEGQDVFIRMPASELEKEKTRHKIKTAVIVVAVIGVGTGLLLLILCIRRKRSLKAAAKRNKEKEDLELPLFDLATIASATNNFSSTYKLGEGGFGPVYKGTLVDGKEIAVKRLSRSSGQGLTEFKNEVIIIAKLQHRNLVKLIGCCIQGNENLLVYEYMPNKSLDFYIFDQIRGKLLDWSKRFQIILGIARGILYLHQDSRLRIIHRDLKASNVLLDSEMMPKISDFGLARICGGDLTEGNTNRVVGTYGYMAPEYASDGVFSVKSDVFSFGILVLEIITGKKNRGFFHADHTLNLAGHAWRLWKEGNALELIDESLVGSYSNSEVLRCIHVGLLCVQQHPEDRPTMSSVVSMLGNQTALAHPDQPGFFIAKRLVDVNDSSNNQESSSATINEVTNSLLEAR
ncbi:hypothetical protein UlMin_012637 [Ulmus minor]